MFLVCSKLIAEHGFAGTGIRMMADALSASPASLFHLFGSKDGLLKELIAYASQPSLDFYARLKPLDAPAAVKLYKSIYEEVIAVASADRDHAALFYLPEMRQAEFSSAQAFRTQMIEHYETLISEAVKDGELAAVDPAVSAEQVFQLTETSIVGGEAVTGMDPATLAELTADFCFRGLLVDGARLADIRDRAKQLTPQILSPGSER